MPTPPPHPVPGAVEGGRSGVLSVAVLVDLLRNASAGGHVKCWERFAEAAARRAPDGGPGEVDLTVYVLGDHAHLEELSPRVRFAALRPVLSTAPVMPAVGGGDVTDLSPFHPGLAGLLPRHDVWHLTHTFSFGSTAARLVRRSPPGRRPGMVCSLHTDVPALASVYTRQVLGKVPGVPSSAGRPAAGLPGLVEGLLRRRRDRLLRLCDRVLAASPGAREEVGAMIGPERVAGLRRGIDHERFRPDPAARAELALSHRVPADRPLVLFAGRVDASKRALLVAEAVHRLRRCGHDAHLVVVGSGSDTDRIAGLLGPAASVLGPQPQDTLARVYAACDVFAFPSRTETAGNVVAEAMACGLPVVLPANATTTQWFADPGRDGMVVADDTTEGWARALEELLVRPEARRAMGRRAARTARSRHPTWTEVLEEDLLPVWTESARTRTAVRRP
ncbi:glycosyltransferase [Streptomyces sp. HMX87]|uniref:glycosyltransferase n=1 Tax=Streptomyces sp. HMX87 TaxID=3390849 RepID=UPI003A87D122